MGCMGSRKVRIARENVPKIVMRAGLPTRLCVSMSRSLHSSACLLARARTGRRVASVDGLLTVDVGQAPKHEGETSAADSLHMGNAVVASSEIGGITAALSGNKLKGAHFDKRSRKWKSSITVDGVRKYLGTFISADEAARAYAGAAASGRGLTAPLAQTQKRRKQRIAGVVAGDAGVGRKALITRAEAERLGIAVLDFDIGDASASHSASSAAPPQAPNRAVAPQSSRYVGVVRSDATEVTLWEAVYTLPGGKEVSGGEYDSEEGAARAADALVRMYGGPTPVLPLNFPVDPYSAWVPPDEVVNTGQIEVKDGVPLDVEEICGALKQERGLDVRAVPLAGRSDLADALVFATGRSVPHMRRMADMVARALRKRRLPGIDEPGVENREGDDWMVVDCGNVIVNIMDAEAREVFDLEAFYEGMKLGTDPYDGMSFEQWLEKNPVPDKWLKRLEKDEVELSGKGLQGVSSPVSLAAGPRDRRGGGRGGPDRKVAAYHFPAKVKAKPKT